MYASAFDDASGVYVCSLAPGGDADHDFARHIENLRAAHRAVAGVIDRLAVCVVLRAGHPVPNARWRAEVAKLMTLGELRASMAVVTSNPMIRGVLTALSWTVKGDAVRFRLVANVDDAHRWLRQERSDDLPALAALTAALDAASVAQQP